MMTKQDQQLQQQQQQPMEDSSCYCYSSKSSMVLDHDHLANPHRSFPSPGPTFDIYDVGTIGDAAALGFRALQPFHIHSFKSPEIAGDMAATTLGFPFTNAQWKELERQAMVYKYMVASVPVPPHLLIPVDSALLYTRSSVGNGGVNLRFTNGGDREPGRCRRTDGKKWRCSRDAAPDQKYCERHMHRGRPRSRKPVEVHANNISKNNTDCSSNKKTRHNAPSISAESDPDLTNDMINGSSSLFLDNLSRIPHLQSSPADHFHGEARDKMANFDANMAFISEYKEPTRNLNWVMKGDAVPISTSDRQWHGLVHTEIGLGASESCFNNNASVLDQQRYPDDTLNLNLFESLEVAEDQGRNQEMLFLESVSLNTKLPPSLTLSVGRIESDQNHEGDRKAMASASWATSNTPGGPLAEVLQQNHQSLSLVENGDSEGTRSSTAASFTSGVLQEKSLGSFSDCSDRSSSQGIIDNAKTKSEITLLC